MQAWGKSQDVPDGLQMLADGNADFTRALGLEMDASGYGMGMRSKRYALYAEDGVVKQLWTSNRQANSRCLRPNTYWQNLPTESSFPPLNKASAMSKPATHRKNRIIPTRASRP